VFKTSSKQQPVTMLSRGHKKKRHLLNFFTEIFFLEFNFTTTLLQHFFSFFLRVKVGFLFLFKMIKTAFFQSDFIRNILWLLSMSKLSQIVNVKLFPHSIQEHHQLSFF